MPPVIHIPMISITRPPSSMVHAHSDADSFIPDWFVSDLTNPSGIRYTPPMRYVMRQRFWSWGDDYTIKNEGGEGVFFVDGRAFSFGNKLSIDTTDPVRLDLLVSILPVFWSNQELADPSPNQANKPETPKSRRQQQLALHSPTLNKPEYRKRKQDREKSRERVEEEKALVVPIKK